MEGELTGFADELNIRGEGKGIERTPKSLAEVTGSMEVL